MITYRYNAEGKRIAKTVLTSDQRLATSDYTYDGWKVMKEVSSGQGTVNSEIQYNYYNEDTPISITYAGQTYFYLTNGHGDITGMTDSSGTVIARYSYDTWGRPIDTWTDETTVAAELLSANPYQYASYRFDDETGFYYLRNRYYDPRIGRFISKDKFAGTMTEPTTQNRYVYCGNNPVSKTDPSGLWGFAVHHGKTRGWAFSAANKIVGRARARTVALLVSTYTGMIDTWFPGSQPSNAYYHFRPGADAAAYYYLNKAAKEGSYYYLGIAIHAKQDAICHGWIGFLFHTPDMDKWNKRPKNIKNETRNETKSFVRSYLERSPYK